ncbi:MAG: hypothetical protein KAX95_04155, partial [Pseudomonas sp.]|nr:hypothetical protein [Pseudomonas sp.]
MQHQDWQRDSQQTSLRAYRDDALCTNDYLRQQHRRKRSAFWHLANVLGVLGVLALAVYLLAAHNSFSALLQHKTSGLLNPATTRSPASTASDHETPVNHRAALTPAVAAQPSTLPIASGQPLANCIKPGNLIDSSVVNCRYGELPRAAESAPSQGMVSAEYLAQYQADKANGRRTPTRQNAANELTEEWIRKWDGNGQYLAQWQSINNRIDSSSVCSNHKRGSIDYRGCRKAAKVHFREQCRAWELRRERDGEDISKRMAQRYCSAANGFSPMG